MSRNERMEEASKPRREQELDDMLEALLEARDRLERTGRALGAEALTHSAGLLRDGARTLAREADRIDPAPWHEKLWRKIKRAS